MRHVILLKYEKFVKIKTILHPYYKSRRKNERKKGNGKRSRLKFNSRKMACALTVT